MHIYRYVYIFITFAVLALITAIIPLQAQTSPGFLQSPTEKAPVVPAPIATPPLITPSTETPVLSFRAILDPIRADLDRIEAALKRDDISEGEIERFRARLPPLIESLRRFILDSEPKVEAAKARLDQLGPKPDDKSPMESPELSLERTEREKDLKEALEGQKLGNALLVQAEQQATTLSQRKRSAFRKVLLEQHTSPLVPDLWLGVIKNFSQDMSAIRLIQGDWIHSFGERLTDRRGILLFASFLLALGMTFLRRYLQTKVVLRNPVQHSPARSRIALAALAHIFLRVVPIGLGCYFIFNGLQLTGLTPPRVFPVITAILSTVVFIAFVRALSDALLAPDIPHWRYIDVQDQSANLIHHLAVSIAFIVSFNKIGEAMLQATAASTPLIVVWRGAFTLVFAVTCMGVLRKLNQAAPSEDTACLGPYVPPTVQFGGPLRLIAWGIMVAIVICIVSGYITLAEFLMDQTVWISLVCVLLLFGLNISQDLIGNSISGDTRLSLAIQLNVGVRKRSLQQISVIMTGLTRLLLITLAAILVLAPWGFETDSLWSSVKTAFFGFKIGDVTISVSAVLTAIIFFVLGLVATRGLQRWLDKTYLPSTNLDSGLRNSIKTAFGYLGVLVAVMLAFAQLGLSLDKITIVAGALSVGIGFGLQSIVGNFVSGLILLWERPIRVDDLIVAGDVEGYVRQINVRATEIETFDRAMVMVPNANLITAVVKNRMRKNKLGRVVIPLSVPRTSDPQQVRAMMLEVASKNADVLSDPAPKVFFKKIHDTMLDFELIAFIANVDMAALISSDLHFAIFSNLQSLSISPLPLPTSNMNLIGLDRLENTLEHIAEAIEHEHEQKLADGKSAQRRRMREAKQNLMPDKKSKD